MADEVARTVEQSLAHAQRLRQSILKKAFEGKLVSQDANDEPAYILLERIKEKRAQIETEGRAKKKSKIKPSYKEMEKMEKDTETLKQTIGLYELLKASKKLLTPKELWLTSKLDIEDFYKFLKIEVESGRIIEKRPNDSDVYLEVEDATR